MLALVAGVERRAARQADRFTVPALACWAHTRESVDVASRCPLVVLGDSLVKHGVVPAVLQRRLGRPSYNLAVSGGHAPASYFLLRRLLRAGARPEAVLVDGETLGSDPLGQTRAYPYLLGVAECAEMARAGRDPRFLAVTALAHALPTYKARLDLRWAVLAALRGDPPGGVRWLPHHVRNWRRNGNAELLPPRDGPAVAAPVRAALERDGHRPANWSCRPCNAAFVDRLLGLAASRGIPVFWLLPPYHPAESVFRDRNGTTAAYEAFVRGLVRRYPNLTVVDGLRAGYPDGALADTVHLNRVGAVAFSDAVAGVVVARLRAGPAASVSVSERWVELPRWREGVSEEVGASVAVEDLEQSSRALARLAAEHRATPEQARAGGRDGARQR
jgi:hypothetical protein